MNVWAKLITALRGGVSELGETTENEKAIEILKDELAHTQEELDKSRQSLAAMIARKKVNEDDCSVLEKQIKEYEGYAKEALQQKDEVLALEVANKIAELEARLQAEKQETEEVKGQIKQVQLAIKHVESNMRRMKQQMDTVVATERVLTAQKKLAEKQTGSKNKLRTAKESLEKIKERQALQSIEQENSKEKSLRERLQGAGIVASEVDAKDILERIKKDK